MGSMMWVLKNKALDAWEARSAAARRAGRWCAGLMAMAAAGCVGYAAWDMADFPKTPQRTPAALTSHASLPGCERRLAGLGRGYRAEEWFFGRRLVSFGCRKEAGGEFVERRRMPAAGSDGLLAASMRLRGEEAEVGEWAWLDGLEWREARRQASWRGLAESLGAAELTMASRGFDASSETGWMAWWEWIPRIGMGLMGLVGLLGWALAWLIPWMPWALGGALGVLARALASEDAQRLSRGQWALSAAAGVVALGLMGPAASALIGGMAGVESPGRWRGESAARAAPMEDCRERLSKVAAESATRVLRCVEEGGAMTLVVLSEKGRPAGWVEDVVGVDLKAPGLRLGPAASAGSAWSWRVFGELSGWLAPTAASRPWADLRAPWAGGVWDWGWEQWREHGERCLFGVAQVLAALGLIAMALWGARWIKTSAGSVVAGARSRVDQWNEDPEFRARAERREMEKAAARAGEAGRGRGRRRL